MGETHLKGKGEKDAAIESTKTMCIQIACSYLSASLGLVVKYIVHDHRLSKTYKVLASIGITLL